MTMITTRADLDAFAGTPEHAAFMALLEGSTFRAEFDASAGAWVAVEDEAMISQFGFTPADFPGRQVPDLSALPLPSPPTSDDVNRERDRRIAQGATVDVVGYGPIPLQGREKDQTNLLGLVTAAQIRLAGGDNVTLTKFRDASNIDHMLIPAQIIELWSLGAAWISATYDASWDIKALDPIPVDYVDDGYWP
jgi:hypothetical protein